MEVSRLTTVLGNSLAGVTVEFKSKGEPVAPVTEQVKNTIQKEIEKALRIGGPITIHALAEMYSYYQSEPYYMGIRRNLVFGKVTKDVQKLIKDMTLSDRREFLLDAIAGSKGFVREVLFIGVRYYLRRYPKYVSEFKSVLTKEEFYDVAY